MEYRYSTKYKTQSMCSYVRMLVPIDDTVSDTE